MKQALKQVVNALLAPLDSRVVSAQWGPRGFAAALRRLKQQGMRARQIVDVGAARGEWTRECRAVFPEAHYLLIDPLEENQPALRALQADTRQIAVWPGAAGAREGTLALHVHGDQSSFLTSPSWGGPARSVPVRALDSFLGTELAHPPDLIKADVQGFELEVLRGAERCLASASMLLLEVSFRRLYDTGVLAHDVVAYAAQQGFRIYDICSYAQRPKDRELVQADVLFVRDGTAAFADERYD